MMCMCDLFRLSQVGPLPRNGHVDSARHIDHYKFRGKEQAIPKLTAPMLSQSRLGCIQVVVG